LKKNLPLTVLLLTFLLITITLTPIIQPVNAASKTVYVDDDNIAGPWDGTTLHPYQNITSGLEHAASGDTIFVYNGTYHEHLFINK